VTRGCRPCCGVLPGPIENSRSSMRMRRASDDRGRRHRVVAARCPRPINVRTRHFPAGNLAGLPPRISGRQYRGPGPIAKGSRRRAPPWPNCRSVLMPHVFQAVQWLPESRQALACVLTSSCITRLRNGRMMSSFSRASWRRRHLRRACPSRGSGPRPRPDS
jgi:hypothetical protein